MKKMMLAAASAIGALASQKFTTTETGEYAPAEGEATTNTLTDDQRRELETALRKQFSRQQLRQAARLGAKGREFPERATVRRYKIKGEAGANKYIPAGPNKNLQPHNR